MTTIKFWKPYQVLTHFSGKDDEGRATLSDYIELPDVRVAGRLDYDSEGLMILTDDGKLNHMLTHPKFFHPRTYWAQVEHIPTEEALHKLREGVVIKGYKTRPAVIERIPPPELPERIPPIRERQHIPTAWIAITLTEGKNRQVRRMTAAVGNPTLRLHRAKIGEITLEGLLPGTWQALSKSEIKRLQKSIQKARKLNG